MNAPKEWVKLVGGWEARLHGGGVLVRNLADDYEIGVTANSFAERLVRSLIEHAEGGEAVGWVFQHDETGRMTFCPNDGVNTPEVFAELNPRYTLCSAAYTHPSPSAVEALARAAEKLERCSYCEDDEGWSALIAALDHPEIAALLKGEKK